MVGDVTYEVKVEVCNVYGLCSTPYGLGTVIGANNLTYAVNVNVELTEKITLGLLLALYLTLIGMSLNAQSVQSWMICGRQLEPSLQYNSGACYSTTAQGSITEPFRFITEYQINTAKQPSRRSSRCLQSIQVESIISISPMKMRTV